VGQPASNVILKRLRPSVWLSFLMLMWGIVMVRRTAAVRAYVLRQLQTLHGVASGYASLLSVAETPLPCTPTS
jgi:hypothetical protein